MIGFAIKATAAVLLYLSLQFYFINRVEKTSFSLFPGLNGKNFKTAKRILVIWINLYLFVFIAVMAYVFINRINGFAPPENGFISWFLVYPFWFGFLLTVQSSVWLLTLDLIQFILRLLKKTDFRKKRFFDLVRLAIVTFFIFYIPARVIYDYRGVEVRAVKYEKEGLPRALDGFKIALIADIQADYYNDPKRVGRYLERVNAQHPDLILIAGDIITGSPKYIEAAGKELGKLSSKKGIFACVGDHDNWAYRFDYDRSLREVKNALRENGIEMVDNGSRIVPVDSSSIGILFVTNTYVEKIPADTLKNLMENCSGCDFRVFLTHQPREKLIRFAEEYGFDLYLSGHTHGGQWTFITPFGMLTPTAIETPYIKGDFRFGSMLAVVNRGLGMSIAPMRYNAEPEITIITLKSK